MQVGSEGSADGQVEFGSLLRHYRARAGLSQEALAERSGISRRGIADLERGARRFPYPDTAVRLAAGLELKQDERDSFMAACRPTLTQRGRHYILETEPSTFVGRQHELAQISKRLTGSRVLTLTGTGGIGKTRLALQLAHEVRPAYDNGVLFVDLAPVFDAALVPQVVAAALGASARPGESRIESVKRHLGPLRLLLILDNCEHLVAPCAQLVDALIRACPNVQLIVTSREPLHIHGKVVWVVPPLHAAESLALFIERAQAGGAVIVPSSRNNATIREICSRLEGIPLAIELAAVRVPTLGVPQVAQLLTYRLDFLSHGTRLDSPRHQALRATLDWSYALLSPSEQRLFTRLSVFVGGWTLTAAREVCGWDGLTPAAVVDCLEGLVDKSLVVTDDIGGQRRFRFLETIREFAVERSGSRGDSEPTRSRHAVYFRAVAEEGAVTRLGIRYPGDVTRISVELANMNTALNWLVEEGRLELGLKMCRALSGFWLAQGFLREGEEWLARFLARADEVPARDAAEGFHAWGRLAEYAGALDRAAGLYEQSLSTAVAHHDATVSARALCGLGDIALHRADYGTATDLFSRALAASRAAGGAAETVQALLGLGRSASLAGEIDQSRAWLEQALAMERRLGDRWGVAYVLNELGQQARRAGQFEQAQALFEECHVLWRQSGTRMGERAAIMNLALVTLELGLVERSAELARDGLELCQDLGDDGSAATLRCIEIAAQVLVALNSTPTAVELIAAVEPRREEVGAPRPAVEQPEIDRLLENARDVLSDQQFGAAWNRGKALTVNAAVTLSASSLMRLIEAGCR